MVTVYGMESTIDPFFTENTTATRLECNDFALRHDSPPVTPVPIQGLFSYTVIVGTNKIFQFRVPNSSINHDLFDLAVATHGKLVPNLGYHSTIEQAQPLCVCEMDKLPGIPYISPYPCHGHHDPGISHSSGSGQSESRAWQGERTSLVTVPFMPWFSDTPPFRRPRSSHKHRWNNPQHLPTTDQITALTSEFGEAFTRLAASLPPRSTPIPTRVRQGLPALLSTSSELPLALTHGDLSKTNLLVDPDTGELTGVIDWAEVRVLPFGFALHGLENLLGYMDLAGWHYYNDAQELRELFWRVFREETGGDISDAAFELIWTARMAGLLYRYGFVVDGREVIGVVGPESSSMGYYLDAFCILEGWVPVGLFSP